MLLLGNFRRQKKSVIDRINLFFYLFKVESMQEQFSRMKETFEKDIRKIREDKTALEIEVASLDKVGLFNVASFP